MQSLMLIKPTLIHKKEILNYQQTYKNAGLTLHGANQLAHFSADTFEDWLAYLSAPLEQITLVMTRWLIVLILLGIQSKIGWLA
ncbi:hypothetical protein ACFGX0_01380 [Pasteurella multocida]|nr:hypothetical protein [Pasteurella multocida]